MRAPVYPAFYFSTYDTPESSQWHTCKEIFGYYIKRDNVNKDIVKFHISKGRHISIRNHVTLLKQYIDNRLKEAGLSYVINVESQTEDSITFTIPKVLSEDRVTPHLIATYVRLYFNYDVKDSQHLKDSKLILKYIKSIGIKRFSRIMNKTSKRRDLCGIVSANKYLLLNSKSKVYAQTN